MSNYPDNFNTAASDRAFGPRVYLEAVVQVEVDAGEDAILRLTHLMAGLKGHTDIPGVIDNAIAEIRVAINEAKGE